MPAPAAESLCRVLDAFRESVAAALRDACRAADPLIVSRNTVLPGTVWNGGARNHRTGGTGDYCAGCRCPVAHLFVSAGVWGTTEVEARAELFVGGRGREFVGWWEAAERRDRPAALAAVAAEIDAWLQRRAA